MKNIIIGTAGHIDHGKTTLIKALTGRNTDKLKDEIKRGISIDLGFTYFDLPSGKRAGIIDVPGHEKFIKKMVSGSAGIDIVLLTIAANEGIKPQTIEHIDILNFLKIKEKIIVITKCSLVENDYIELFIEDIKEQLKDTIFNDCKIICVDSIDKIGLEELIEEVDKLSEMAIERNNLLPPRLYIDRVFSLKGYGTIVTGTLIEGTISIADELVIFPKMIKVKIRNIQVHDNNVKKAFAGQRTALNIGNLKVDEIFRGDLISTETNLRNTTLIDAKIKLSKNTSIVLKFFDLVRIYIGSKEVLARFVPIDVETAKSGESVYCQLRLEEEVAVKKDDILILRSYSPMETIGGGIILEPNPEKHKKTDKKVIEFLKIKENGSDEDIIDEYIRTSTKKRVTKKEIITYTKLSESEIDIILKIFLEKKSVFLFNSFYYHQDIIEELSREIIEILSIFHNKNSLKLGMSNEEIKTKLTIPFKTKDLEQILKKFEDEKIVKIQNNNIVSLYNFKIKFDENEIKIKNDIEKKLKNSGFVALTIEELSGENKKYNDIAEALIDNTIIKLAYNTYVYKDVFIKAKMLLIDYLNKNNKITLAEFRDLIKTSRKYAMLFLEYFDSLGITIRNGDFRVLGNYKI